MEGVKRAANEFMKWANGKLQEKTELEVQMPGELAEDKPLASPCEVR